MCVFRDPHGITYSYAACDLSPRTLSIEEALLLQFLSNNQKFLIPFLAEAFDERFFQELIGFNAFAAAFDEGAAADIPFMKVDTYKIANLAQANRIEVARYGLAPWGASLAIGLFNEADAAAVLVARSKDAVLAVDNGCNQVAVAVVVHHTLLLDNCASLGTHLIFYNLKCLFEFFNLVHEHWCTGITLNTAYSLAVREVTEEILLKKVERNYCISNLYHIILFFAKSYLPNSRPQRSSLFHAKRDSSFHNRGPVHI